VKQQIADKENEISEHKQFLAEVAASKQDINAKLAAI
jgi:hypothetical protein